MGRFLLMQRALPSLCISLKLLAHTKEPKILSSTSIS
jgi:hypothetical protein